MWKTISTTLIDTKSLPNCTVRHTFWSSPEKRLGVILHGRLHCSEATAALCKTSTHTNATLRLTYIPKTAIFELTYIFQTIIFGIYVESWRVYIQTPPELVFGHNCNRLFCNVQGSPWVPRYLPIPPCHLLEHDKREHDLWRPGPVSRGAVSVSVKGTPPPQN